MLTHIQHFSLSFAHAHIHTLTHTHTYTHTHTHMYTHIDIPEGTSTEQIGVFTLLKVDKMSSNGALTAPLKLNPNMASMTTWYSLSISSGNGS